LWCCNDEESKAGEGAHAAAVAGRGGGLNQCKTTGGGAAGRTKRCLRPAASFVCAGDVCVPRPREGREEGQEGQKRPVHNAQHGD
jgi:hypothetical protein